MDSFGQSSSGKDDELNGQEGAQEAAEQALMNEDIEVSPVPQRMPTMHTVGGLYARPGMPSQLPTDNYMNRSSAMAQSTRHHQMPMVGGTAMPPHGYPGVPVQYAHHSMASMTLDASSMAGLPHQQQQQPHLGLMGAATGYAPKFAPHLHESGPRPVGKRGLEENEEEKSSFVEGSHGHGSIPSAGKRARLSDDLNGIQPSQAGAPRHALFGGSLPASTSNGASSSHPQTASNGSNSKSPPRASSETASMLPLAPAVTTNENDVFADADDDAPLPGAPTMPSSGFASTSISSPPRASYQSQALSADKRPSIRSIVLGSVAKAVVEPAAKTAPEVSDAHAAPDTAVVVKVPDVPTSKATEPPKKKRKMKPAKKVLVSRKEKLMAISLLQGAVELECCLPIEDAKFLAEACWIFTVQQLEWIITKSQDESMETDAANHSTARMLLDQIIVKLATGDIIGPPTPTGRQLMDGSSSRTSTTLPAHTDTVSSVIVPIREEAEPNSEVKSSNIVVVELGPASTGDKLVPHLPSGNDKPQSTGVLETSKIEDKATGSVTSLTDRQRNAASAKLDTWRKLLAQFDPLTRKPLEEQFRLNGPIFFLIPEATRNFLASVPIISLYGFLSLRKTETGAICDMYRLWRKHCSLPDLAPLVLGRHLISTASRIESALTSSPPVDDYTRKWTSDPMVALTGAARDFLVFDQGLFTAYEFVEKKTKDLAAKLEEWRVRKNMPVLKGSGKVAMISQWKASAKEAMEVEKFAGTILSDVNLEALSAAETPIIKDDTVTVVKTIAKRKDLLLLAPVPPPPPPPLAAAVLSTLPPRTNDRAWKYTINSTMFLHDILGAADSTLLKSVDVNTAAEFFNADKTAGSGLQKAIIDANRVTNSSECEALFDEWNLKLKNDLDIFRRSKSETVKPLGLPPKKNLRKPKTTPARRIPSEKLVDPYQGLSTVTQRFLRSINISTAEVFLTTRTTDIAGDFVQFRINENMPELKGLGAIASVSGWKAQVRKFAIDMGKEEVADLEPADKASWGKEARQANAYKTKDSKEASRRRKVPPTSSIQSLSHNDVLFGKSRVVFAVQGVSGEPYKFELSVRKSEEDERVAIFATYKGLVTMGSDRRRSSDTSFVKVLGLKGASSSTPIRLLSDIPFDGKTTATESRSLFKTLALGCGLVDLRKYGVRQLNTQDLSLLKEAMKAFVLTGDVALSREGFPEVGGANVLVDNGAEGEFKYCLYSESCIQKGQSVALRFPDVSTLLKSDAYDNTAFRQRHLLRRALHAATRQDLLSLQGFLKTDLLEACGFGAALRAIREENNDEDAIGRISQALISRQRLRWLSLRVSGLVGDPLPEETFSKFSFDWKTLIRDEKMLERLSQDRFLEVKQAMTVEIKQELLAALELDWVCGSSQREEWCPLALKLFDTLVEALVAQYCSPAAPLDQAAEVLSSIFRKVYSAPLVLDDCVLQRRHANKTSENGSDSSENDEPDTVLDNSTYQAYLDTMSLCGESSYDLSGSKRLEMVVCDEPASVPGGMPIVVMKRPAEVRKGDAVLSDGWYRNIQKQITFSVVSRFTTLTSVVDKAWFDVEKIEYSLKQVVKSRDGLNDAQELENTSRSVLRLPVPTPVAERRLAVPHSNPFFFGLVWPVLRKSGWRLEAGDDPLVISFFTPGLIGRKGMRAKLLKQDRDRSRAKLARDTHEVGLGFVPKRSKRLFIATVLQASKGDLSSSEAEQGDPITADADTIASGVPVKEIFDKFLALLQGKLEESDQEGRDRAKSITMTMKHCFDALAPQLCDLKDAHDQKPSDTLGCDALMQFLLFLPSALRQPSLPLKQTSDTLAAIQELADFVTLEYQVLLDKRFHPPTEHYVGQGEQRTRPSALVSRLRLQSLEQREESEPSLDVLLATDKSKLTDFVASVLESATICIATFEDTKMKNRSIEEGFPGLTCRYCLGTGGEGRYFFKTAESLSTTASVLDKHFAKCTSVPHDVKSHIALCKRRHREQKKHLAVGARLEFFHRFWGRMWSISKISQPVPPKKSSNVSSETATQDSNKDSDAGSNVEFHDHVALLDFIRTTAPWKGDKRLNEALDQYYNSLEYGGRIFGTSAMPKNFNSEWLLAKVAPRKSRKRSHMPG